MRGSRVAVNLVALGVVSAMLVLYAITQLLVGVFVDRTYPVEVTLPESGGLIAGQEVALAGRVIGRVGNVRLEGDGVVARLNINEGEQIPQDSRVVVQRRSTVGEQALDFQPTEGREPYYEPGDQIDGLDAAMPVAIEELLVAADTVFGEIDPDATGRLVTELADAVRGRRGDIRAIISGSAEFSATVADGSDDFDRLFREGRRVTAELAEHREAITRNIGEMADAAAILTDMRRDFEGLLTDGPPALAQLGGVVERSQADLGCLIRDFGHLNAFLAQPEVLGWGADAFAANQWFFTGFDLANQPGPEGRVWNRVMNMEGDPPPRSYLPDKLPIPDILPGGACTSPLGVGAPAAFQPGWEKAVPDATLVPPEDPRTTPARAVGPPLSRPPAAAPADRRLPATGGAGLPFALGILLLAAALHTLRNRI
jgi:virulence factor Mce-like protein